MSVGDQQTESSSTRSQRTRWVLVAAAGGALAVLLLWSWFGDGPGGDEPAAVSVFMVPEFVPEGFELTFGAMADADRQQTGDPNEAAGIVLEYRPIGSLGAGDPHLLVFVRDQLANPEMATCEHEAGTAGGRIDPESCIEAAEQRLSALPGTRGFERTELRGLPAYIVRASGTTLYDFSVTVFEGVTVSSEVAGYHVDEADVLEVAYSLRTVETGDFIDYVSGDG